jgi:hypothetical protein
MADDSEDLVSQIKVTGGPQATAEIQSFADKGSAAFDKLNKSAATSAAGIGTAAANIQDGAKKTATGLQAVGNVPISGNLVAGLKNIENALGNVTKRIPQLTQAIGRFTQRFALVGAAAATGAVGLAAAARSIAKSVDGESNSFEKLTNQQIEANNSQLSGEVAAINHASALRKLSADLAAGKITYTQYNEAVKQSNAEFQEQTRVAAEVEIAQRRVKEENDRLTKSLADRTAMNKLIDTFGGPLTSSLISFGRQVEGVRQQFITAFSPSKNAVAISKFFDAASIKLQNLITNNGPALAKFFETLGTAAAAVFNGLIEAAPGVLDFFNNQLVPAITKVVGFFNTLATAINTVFGTKLTGGSVILIAILAQVTGSIRVLFTVVRAGGAVFKGLIALLGEVGIAIAEVFGAKKVSQIIKFGTAVGKGGGPIKTFLAAVRTAIPLIVAMGEAVAVALGIGFAPAIAIITALGVALFFLLKNVDWKAFSEGAQTAIASIISFFTNLVSEIIRIVGRIITGIGIINTGATQAFITAWNAVVTFFTTTLPNGISAAFAALWSGVTAAATFVANAVIAAWNLVVTFFTVTLPTAITTVFTTLWTGITTAAGVAAQFVIDKWNTLVAFFTGLPGTLQAIWDTISLAITTAFQTALDSVTNFFSNMASKVTSILQPVINLLKSIISLGSQASSAADGAAGGGQFAGGGRVRGPGSGTSDSIAAWLSNGEFVMRARAVAQYGSAFMHAINNGSLRLPQFALGGMPMIAPAPARRHFAEGGAVSGGRKMDLHIGGETFAGLTVPVDVADRLSRFATIRQVRSAGRKPSWVGRGK